VSLAPIAEARTALKLAAKACLAATRTAMRFPTIEGPALIETIHRFVRTIDGNVHLARVAHDGAELYAAELSKISAQKVQHWKALRVIRKDLERRYPRWPSATASVGPEPARRPFDYFDALIAQMLAAPSGVKEGNTDDSHDGSVEPGDVLSAIVDEVLPGLESDARESALEDDRKAIKSANDALRVLRSATLILGGVHARSKLVFLREIVDGTNPSVGTVAWYLGEAEVGVEHLYRRLFFEPGRLDTGQLGWVQQFQLQVAAAVTAVEADFQARLGDRASIDWLVRRYAERCRQLRAAELRELLKKVTRQKEHALTREMATYLFDQGLDVLIELPLGASRYDVYAPATLLLEAKVCSASKTALRATAEWLRQISSYKLQLRSERATVDPVLVVFCVDGRQPDLPLDHTIGSLTVSIVVVDVAPPNQRGHRAAAPVHVTTEQIAAQIDRLAPKGAKGDVRRR
jgi:hypothetical protein